MLTRNDPKGGGEWVTPTREVISEASKIFGQLGFSNLMRAMRVRWGDGKKREVAYQAIAQEKAQLEVQAGPVQAGGGPSEVMIANLFLRDASAGTELIRSFGARLILAMGYGLRQVPASERKTILEKGLRELWFWRCSSFSGGPTSCRGGSEGHQQGLAPFSLKPLATNLNRVAERLEALRSRRMRPAAMRTWPGPASFQNVARRRRRDSLTKALRILPLDAAQEQLFKEWLRPTG